MTSLIPSDFQRTRLIPLAAMARLARVPARWLRTEAIAGRLPHLAAGSQILFDAEIVLRILEERARALPISCSTHAPSESNSESVRG